jgi:metabolite-proton symporter
MSKAIVQAGRLEASQTTSLREAEEKKVSSAYRRLVFASAFGTAIEHYDFFCYAITAPLVFDVLFFPKMDPVAAMIAVYATFAIGFLARPLGGIFFGHYGDKIGRKKVLTLTLMLMGVATFLIGCLPSYSMIGFWAPVLLVTMRFIQGFAFGGEYMNAVALTLENAPSEKRGFFASFVNASGPVGIILASGLIAILSMVYDKHEFQEWVWRIPFLLSFVLIAIGGYVRCHVDESLLFKCAKESNKVPKVPLVTVLRSWKKSTALACVVNMAHSSFQYLSTIFVLGYAVKKLGMAQSGMVSATTVANVLEMLAVPIIAHYSDRIGRRPFIIGGIILAAIWFPFYFEILLLKNVLYLTLGLVMSIGVIHAMMFAPEAAFTAELFPTEVRVSGSSLGKQLGIILGGGCAPLIATSLMSQSISFTPVVLYFEAIAAIAFVGILFAPENFKRSL